MSTNGGGETHGHVLPMGDDGDRIDGLVDDVRALSDGMRAMAYRQGLMDQAMADHAGRESKRGHEHASALLILTADVATLTQRIDAQEDLHSQRHRMLLDAVRDLGSGVAMARSRSHEALTVAEEARASRPDDGRLDAIAADALAATVERGRNEAQIAAARAHDSIRARAERRQVVAKVVGVAVGGSSVAYAALDLFTKLFGG